MYQLCPDTEFGAATPFERRDYGRELMMCQRYFYKTASDAVFLSGYAFLANSADGLRAPFTHPVTMRAPPAVTVTSFQAGGTNSQMVVSNSTAHSVVMNLRSTGSNTAVFGICGIEANIEL